MTPAKFLAVALVALLVTTGAAAAASGTAPENAGGTDAAQGPASDLPDQVPDFVSGIHDTVRSFLNGDLTGSLGEAVSDLAGGEKSESGNANGGNANGGNASTDHAGT